MSVLHNLKSYLRAHRGYICKDFARQCREWQMRVLEAALPRNYYIEQYPDCAVRLGCYPEFRGEASRFNRGEKYRATRDGNRVVMARMLLDLAAVCASGDYAEVGTFKGNFARIIWEHVIPDARFFCFDTFEGFDARDVSRERDVTNVRAVERNFSDTNLDQARATITAGRADGGRLALRKGYFPDTFAGLEDNAWRFVHLDVDLYDPTAKALELFWPRMVLGGVLLIHDYNGHYRGVKKATDEFFGQRGITPVPQCDKVGSAVVIKQR